VNAKSEHGPLKTTDTAPYSWLVVAVGLSVLLHLAVLLLNIEQRKPSESAKDLLISLRPLEPVAPVQSPLPPEIPEPDDPQEQPQQTVAEPEPQLSEFNDEVSDSESVIDESSDSPLDQVAQPPTEPAMTTRLLSSVRENLGRPTLPAPSDITTPAVIPDLPDAPGWIDQFVGEVDGRIEQWQHGDGTIESRIVTASGRIICGTTNTPSAADIFNPQFATNIMRFRECGRERRQAPDSSDPRLRTPRPTP
jgi:hypothetical protein